MPLIKRAAYILMPVFLFWFAVHLVLLFIDHRSYGNISFIGLMIGPFQIAQMYFDAINKGIVPLFFEEFPYLVIESRVKEYILPLLLGGTPVCIASYFWYKEPSKEKAACILGCWLFYGIILFVAAYS